MSNTHIITSKVMMQLLGFEVLYIAVCSVVGGLPDVEGTSHYIQKKSQSGRELSLCTHAKL